MSTLNSSCDIQVSLIPVPTQCWRDAQMYKRTTDGQVDKRTLILKYRVSSLPEKYNKTILVD